MGKFLFDKQKGKSIFFSNKKLKELTRIKHNEYHRKPEVRNKRRMKNILRSINYWEDKINIWKVEFNKLKNEKNRNIKET